MRKKVKGLKSSRSKINSSIGPREIQIELTLGDLELLRTQYYILDKFRLELSDFNARVHSPSPGRLAVYEKNLQTNIRFSIFLSSLSFLGSIGLLSILYPQTPLDKS